jgi:hypothetical protein
LAFSNCEGVAGSMLGDKRFSLVKPTVQTPFHIDFDWWRQNDRSWRIYLRGYLSPEDQESLDDADEVAMVDLVDSETAEIHRVDGLQHLLITRYADREDFITETTSLVEAIFRLFLTSGNTPMSAEELGERLGRHPRTILRTISGLRVYKGMRPLLGN